MANIWMDLDGFFHLKLKIKKLKNEPCLGLQPHYEKVARNTFSGCGPGALGRNEPLNYNSRTQNLAQKGLQTSKVWSDLCPQGSSAGCYDTV